MPSGTITSELRADGRLQWLNEQLEQGAALAGRILFCLKLSKVGFSLGLDTVTRCQLDNGRRGTAYPKTERLGFPENVLQNHFILAKLPLNIAEGDLCRGIKRMKRGARNVSPPRLFSEE
ncbi:MAG: hypothetical protein ACR2IV_13750 [Bryobacteraceae bacterium]